MNEENAEVAELAEERQDSEVLTFLRRCSLEGVVGVCRGGWDPRPTRWGRKG